MAEIDFLSWIIKICKFLKKKICNECHGHGKVKCECVDIPLSNNYSYKNQSEHIFSFSPSIKNKTWKRNVKIQFSVYSKRTDKLLKTKCVNVTLPGYATKHCSDLVELRLNNLSKLETKLGRNLKDSDFETKVELINIAPLKNCKDCKGKGIIKCPMCKGRRISFRK